MDKWQMRQHSVAFLRWAKLMVVLLLVMSEVFWLSLPSWASAAAPSMGEWITVGSLSQGRQSFGGTLMLDGRVLIAGGNRNDFGPQIPYAEIYDPLTQTWSQTGSVLYPREIDGVGLVTLQNGDVLLSAGRIDNTPFADTELYNPQTQQWTETGSLNSPRRAPTNMVLLDDGRVLIAGGTSSLSGGALASSEVYDPATGSWSYTNNDLAIGRVLARMLKLNNGKVLLLGGTDSNNACLNDAELFDPRTDTWSSLAPAPMQVNVPDMTLLPDGRVFVTGGYCSLNSNTSAIYDPASNTWTTVAPVPQTPVKLSFLLDNGDVLVRSGSPNAGATPGTIPPSDEVYDPTTDTWTVTTLPFGDPEGVAIPLTNGDVLSVVEWDCDPSNPACILPTTELFTTGNQPPRIPQPPNATINEGDTYAANGSFTDPDSSSWTAVVDYGDGSGVQSLPLSGTSFNLNHSYAEEGTYTVTVTVADNQGATGTGTATVTVTNAPFTVSTITAPMTPTPVNTSISASATFTDPGTLDTHAALWDWGDGTTSAGTVTESNGSGSVQASHTYTTAGVYTVNLTVTDDDGLSMAASPFQYVVVYDPNAGFVTGGGWYTSPAGACLATPSASGKLHFGIDVKYQAGATMPSGSTQLTLQECNLSFQSTSYQWLVIAGTSAQFEGTGTINGSGNYTFLITLSVGDSTGSNLIRIKIWDTSTGTIIYDSQPGAPDTATPTTAIGAGNLKIH